MCRARALKHLAHPQANGVAAINGGKAEQQPPPAGGKVLDKERNQSDTRARRLSYVINVSGRGHGFSLWHKQLSLLMLGCLLFHSPMTPKQRKLWRGRRGRERRRGLMRRCWMERSQWSSVPPRSHRCGLGAPRSVSGWSARPCLSRLLVGGYLCAPAGAGAA